LSAARNAGAAAASGRVLAFTDDDCEPDPEWVARLRRAFAACDGTFAAIGGPNLPPPPHDAAAAVVAAAPGAPSHVMIDDVEAEHLPGCNLAVTREAFGRIGGFDARFHTAGDDVDFCWRLRDAGLRLGFAPGAFVWHRRRASITGFLRQQSGYGRAEAMLMRKHPDRFTARGHTRWLGFVYGGGPVRVAGRAVIYHGGMGTAGYQGLHGRTLPLPGLAPRFDTWPARLALRAVRFLQPGVRAWARSRRWVWPSCESPHAAPPADDEIRHPVHTGLPREAVLKLLIDAGWHPAGPTDDWDLQRDGTRLMIAIERGAAGMDALLVRLWGGDARRIAHDVFRALPALAPNTSHH